MGPGTPSRPRTPSGSHPVRTGSQGPTDAGRPAPLPPCSTPLELVSTAVAGEDLDVLAGIAARALRRPVAIVIPALGEPLAAPADSFPDGELREIARYADTLLTGEPAQTPPVLADALAVQIGGKTVGIVGAARDGARTADPAPLRAWLEGTAAAVSVAALLRSAHGGGVEGSRRALLQALRAGPPVNVEAFVARAQHLGFDLGAGGIGLCARRGIPAELAQPALVADLGEGRLYGLLPPAAADRARPPAGEDVAFSTPRRDPAELHDALREAELLLELGPPPQGQLQVYRLLIGVLLRDAAELERLRSQTIDPLAQYDAEHDTELVATLEQFLHHHGSTTQTAEAMGLHRHTVGYRLARVHELSALSPYESEGRERLSLGLKAHQILSANERLTKPG